MREQTGKSILLIGLADTLASDLRKALPEQGWIVHSQPEMPGGAEEPAADLIFCGVEPEKCRKLIALAKSVLPGLPVIVVSRRSEISDWLDAMEAGAADYCAPPFDARHIQWIIQSALKSRTLAA